eukprot:453360-Pelagomonas_calceolata.AAC.3
MHTAGLGLRCLFILFLHLFKRTSTGQLGCRPCYSSSKLLRFDVPYEGPPWGCHLPFGWVRHPLRTPEGGEWQEEPHVGARLWIREQGGPGQQQLHASDGSACAN